MELRSLAAKRRDPDGVLEQAARVGVVRLRRRQRAQRLPQHLVLDEPRNRRPQPRMRHLRGQELQEPVQLGRVPPKCRSEIGRIGSLGGLERAHLELKPVAEALHAPEHANRVAFAEAAVQELDVGPDPRLDPPARIDEFERQVRRAALGAPPLLARDRVDALDDPVLR